MDDLIHRRKKRADIIKGSDIPPIIAEINNEKIAIIARIINWLFYNVINANNKNYRYIIQQLIKANYDITDLAQGKEIINEEENIKIPINTIDIQKNNGSVDNHNNNTFIDFIYCEIKLRKYNNISSKEKLHTRKVDEIFKIKLIVLNQLNWIQQNVKIKK